MKVLPDGRIQCRVKITGTVKGVPFEYVDSVDMNGSQYIWPPDKEGNVDASEWWWSQGNFGCDCNRSEFITPELRDTIKDQHGEIPCGESIRIESIVPIELGPNGEELPSLHLCENP